MEDEPTTDTAQEVIDGTEAALSRLGVRQPKNRRWPMRVDLAEVADALGPSGDKGLLRWIAEKISIRADHDIQPVTLSRWLRLWPSVIILDGLDEVTSPEVRRRIIDEIEAFAEQADLDDADLLLIITTRPTGYSERISPEHFTQLDLRNLTPEAAVKYGQLVTNLRLADDLDKRDQVLKRFEKNAHDSNMARLMKTPLQVLIMTIILERLGTLPADRYQLFWRYYETIYERESGKTTTLSSLLTTHRASITELHEAVGLALQVQSETSTEAQALLPLESLRALAEARMTEVGYEQGATIADKIVAAATERLVLLVAHEDGTVTFELRSLQELMAARALSNAPDEEVERRLHLTARSPHWRNTWSFTAGRLFAEGPDYRRDMVCRVVETVDSQDEWPSWLCSIGPELAADLLSEGLAFATPKWQRRLIKVALRALGGPMPLDIVGLARGLSATTDSSNNLLRIRSAIQSALDGTPLARETATMLFQLGTFGPTVPGMSSNLSTDSRPDANATQLSVAEVLRPKMDQVQMDASVSASVEAVLNELANLKLMRHSDGYLAGVIPDPSATWTTTVKALQDPEVAVVLELLFKGLDTTCWPVALNLASAVWPNLSRPAVGHLIEQPDSAL